MEQMINVAEAAKLLNVHPNTIRNMIKDGRVTGYFIGKRILRLKPSEVVAAAEAR